MRARVLLMEDETSVAFPMRRFLAHHELEVDWARELEEAQTLLREHPYPVVIADLRLGGSHHAEGLELLAFVHGHRPETKVILLTAYFTPEVEKEALRRGAVAVLRKPQSLGEIARLVFEALGEPE